MSAIALAAAAAFNLFCTGEAESLSIGFSETKAYSTTFRVDLESEQWCQDECRAVNKIARIEPARLVLRDVDEETERREYHLTETLNRETGEHSLTERHKYERRDTAVFKAGKCEVQPFTGFGGEERLF